MYEFAREGIIGVDKGLFSTFISKLMFQESSIMPGQQRVKQYIGS